MQAWARCGFKYAHCTHPRAQQYSTHRHVPSGLFVCTRECIQYTCALSLPLSHAHKTTCSHHIFDPHAGTRICAQKTQARAHTHTHTYNLRHAEMRKNSHADMHACIDIPGPDMHAYIHTNTFMYIHSLRHREFFFEKFGSHIAGQHVLDWSWRSDGLVCVT
jgi:hypothetical protein